MKRPVIFSIFSFLCAYMLFAGTASTWAAVSPSNRIMLDSLDRVVSKHSEYRRMREFRIEQYKQRLRDKSLTDAQRFGLNEIVGMEYDTFVSDSAIHYRHLNIDLARRMNDVSLENRTRMQLANTLTRSGIYFEAFWMLENIDRKTIRKVQEKEEYYSAYYHLYRELPGNTSDPNTRTEYAGLLASWRDSLRTVTDPASDMYMDMEQHDRWSRGKMDEALEINTAWLSRTTPEESIYGTVLFWRGLFYQRAGDPDAYLECLILSAMSDLRVATTDNTSLRMIANIIFREGDIDRANWYIRVCMDDARYYNARLRGVQLNNTVPLIIDSYNAKIDAKIKQLGISLAVISVTAALILVFTFVFMRQRSKLKWSQKELKTSLEALKTYTEELNTANRDLFEANLIKENYVVRYLELSSSYMDKLEELRRTINKKIREGKSGEVIEMTRPSTDVMEREVSEFYTYFDFAFLAICPTFIEDFNELLLPEERIYPEYKNGKPVLTTELRVFALIRLGFTNSSSIARMLRYSTNTIYNTRAQVKKKAIVARDEFDKLVKQIGTFSELHSTTY